MVVFLCSSCNASLRKNAVETHFHRCRGCRSVSCMDCHSDFDQLSFKSHTSCITEAEKYDKLAASERKTGTSKQAQWRSLVQDAINKSNVQDPLIRQVLKELQTSENVPRKKPKFLNFMKSKYRRLHPDQVENIWNIINSSATTTDSISDTEPPSKKRTLDNGTASEVSMKSVSRAFSMTKTIRRILKGTDGTLGFDALNSKVYSVYKSSIPPNSECLAPNEFKQCLRSTICSKRSLLYSEVDDRVHLLTFSPVADNHRVSSDEVTLHQGDDFTQSHSSAQHTETVANGSSKKTLSDLVVDVLQANGGQMRFKKLLKQLSDSMSCGDVDTDAPATSELLQQRLAKRFKKASRFTLSDDGKCVLLLET